MLYKKIRHRRFKNGGRIELAWTSLGFFILAALFVILAFFLSSCAPATAAPAQFDPLPTKGLNPLQEAQATNAAPSRSDLVANTTVSNREVGIHGDEICQVERQGDVTEIKLGTFRIKIELVGNLSIAQATGLSTIQSETDLFSFQGTSIKEETEDDWTYQCEDSINFKWGTIEFFGETEDVFRVTSSDVLKNHFRIKWPSGWKYLTADAIGKIQALP